MSRSVFCIYRAKSMPLEESAAQTRRSVLPATVAAVVMATEARDPFSNEGRKHLLDTSHQQVFTECL